MFNELIYHYFFERNLLKLNSYRNIIFSTGVPLKQKKITAQRALKINKFLGICFNLLGKSQKDWFEKKINIGTNQLLNRSLISKKKGIAFCHNFSPANDPSAYVSTKRLSSLAEMLGFNVGWKVITSPCSEERDDVFDLFYSNFQFSIFKEINCWGASQLGRKKTEDMGRPCIPGSKR